MIKVQNNSTDPSLWGMSVINTANQKVWYNKTSAYGTEYIGVTPGKSYSIRVEQGDEPFTVCTIYYSKNINSKMPTITDY